MDPCDSCYAIKADLHYFIRYSDICLPFISLLICTLYFAYETASLSGSACATTLLHKICKWL